MNKFVNLSNREHGHLPPRTFPRRLLDTSEDLVARLNVYRKLEKHTRYVTSLCFNAEGDILVTGSADKAVILWDWERGKIKLSFKSGHKAAVFQAKIMPYSNDRSIVTAAFRQLRHAQIDEQGGVTTKNLGLHVGQCLPRFAIQPGSPHIFYFCNQDGIVNQFDLRAVQRNTGTDTQVFYTLAKAREVDYNEIAIDPRNPNLMAVVGPDQYARLYDIRKYRSNNINNQPLKYFCPSHLIGEKKKKPQITSLAFSQQRELLMSYDDEFIYLFTQDMGYDGSDEPQHFSLPVEMTPQIFKGPILKACNFFGPNCEYVVGSSGIGGLFIWKKRDGRLVREIATDNNGVMPDVESHPHTMVLASHASNYRVKIWNVA